MALSRVKTWTAEELTSADLNAEFDNILNNATSLVSPLTANLAMGGYRLTGLGSGSAGSPAIQPTGDTDTGIFFDQANYMSLVSGGSRQLGVLRAVGTGSALMGVVVIPTLTVASGGTHPILSSMYICPPQSIVGSATIVNAASLYIQCKTGATVTGGDYALWVDSDNVRFDGEIFLGDTNQVTLSNQLSAAKLLIASQAAGDTLYANSTTAWSRLAKGTDGQVLRLASGVPSWATSGSEWYPPHGLTLSNGTDTTNDINIAVGDANSNDAAPYDRQVMYLSTGLTKRLDATWVVGTNQGMLASGAALGDGTYHIFLIMRPDTGVVDIAADSSVSGANVAANTNVAYTKMRRIGSIIRSGGTILAFIQNGNEFSFATPVADLDTLNPGTAAVTRTLTVPLGISVLAKFFVQVGGYTGDYTRAWISDLAIPDAAAAGAAQTLVQPTQAAASYAAGTFFVRTNTSGQVRSRLSHSDAGALLYIGTQGWIDERAA